MEINDFLPFITAANFGDDDTEIKATALAILAELYKVLQAAGTKALRTSELISHVIGMKNNKNGDAKFALACQLVIQAINVAMAIRCFKSQFNVTQKITL